jgi:hypothetical protein
MKNIVVRLRGGLGNQLFIVGYALALKARAHEAVKIYSDIREYQYYKARNYELDNLIVSDYLIQYEPTEDESRRKYEFLMEIFHLRAKLLNKIPKRQGEKNGLEYKLGFIYNTSPVELEEFNIDTIYLYGYFVDVKPLLEYRELLCDLFELRNTEAASRYREDIRSAGHSVAISMRLGDDYVKNHWPICTTAYYKAALNILRRPETKVFVFADEMDKAKALFSNDGFVFVDNCSPAEQLSLMKMCDDFIISNSTFSWWGAFLGHREDRVVCCPEVWHKRKTVQGGLYYTNMLVVPNSQFE